MPTYRERLKPRFAALGFIVLLVLGVLLVRLWSMQVLNGAGYAVTAQQNRVREVTTIAPRGRILDRNGKPLVTNRATLAVLVGPESRNDTATLQRLSALLDSPLPEIQQRVASVKESALTPRVVAIDVPLAKVAYLAEHQGEFPGVEVQTRAVREYPQGRVAAHVLGYTGEISESELADSAFKGYTTTDIVGKSGAESSFESVLQGDRGSQLLQVDAQGQARGVLSATDPESGHDVVLTIDTKVQKVAEKALKQAMADAHSQDFTHARAGAIVAVDVTNGEVLAMASAPTYDPTVFLGGVSQQTWRSLTSTDSEYPLSNRAISGQYPPASTFKAFTGLAGLQSGIAQPGSMYYCEGRWTGMGEQWGKWCWNHAGHGNISFTGGIEQSCDTVFYEIGYAFYRDRREKLQKTARSFGYGSKLGIDLHGEAQGRVPDKAWKKAYNENYPEYQRWLPGDTVNMAIGQGDLLVTPLQVASSYAAIANGGTVWKPHILRRVLGSDGKTVLTAKRKVAFKPKVSKANFSVMRQALTSVIQSGTGRGAFVGFSQSVAGKTGTAQVANKDDYAWFVGYAPAAQPRYAVAVVVEQGGHGGSVAGPAARQVLAALLDLPVEHVTATDMSR